MPKKGEIGPKKDPKITRSKHITIRFKTQEWEDLKTFIKDNTDYTNSEFIRRAIKEKQLDLLQYEIKIRKLS